MILRFALIGFYAIWAGCTYVVARRVLETAKGDRFDPEDITGYAIAAGFLWPLALPVMFIVWTLLKKEDEVS